MTSPALHLAEPELSVSGHPDGAVLSQVWFDPETGFQITTATVDVFPSWWAAGEAKKTAEGAAELLRATLSRSF